MGEWWGAGGVADPSTTRLSAVLGERHPPVPEDGGAVRELLRLQEPEQDEGKVAGRVLVTAPLVVSRPAWRCAVHAAGTPPGLAGSFLKSFFFFSEMLFI